MEYPVNLRLTGRRCAVVGGGLIAERKIETLLKAKAQITVISPEVTETVAMLAQNGIITWLGKSYEEGDLSSYFLVICAANNTRVNTNAAAEARRGGALVNVADAPELCDFIVPSQVARGDLLITVSTGGKSPVFTRRLREEMENLYGVEYGEFLELVGQKREEIKCCLDGSRDREAFWRRTIDNDMMSLLRQRKLKEAEEKLKHAIGSIGVKP